MIQIKMILILRKEYYGLKIKDAELEKVLRDAIETYNLLTT